ncbi:MAG: 3-dehydro-L-gulonate 2-dehydrogenase [Ferruginibacter sp.]|nr:3-dehydro-L-gulonate 2-dehydrogenase [Ferruginibacter sp.]
MPDTSFILISPQQMQERFASILLNAGFTKEQANQCASIFTANSVDGIYTHGVNRFPRFVQYIKDGYVLPGAVPTLTNKLGGMEQWDGNLGPGPLNAVHATETVMRLAQQYGIGCVALANTNHWMRGGTYGWQAAKAGLVFIGFTNTTAIMPAWGAIDPRLGNNPLVIALPYQDEAIVLDMAMSQFSYGAMELAVLKNESLRVYGGYNKSGELTNDPATILESKRPLPVGYWKGAGLSLLLDILATVLSGGLSVHQITKKDVEHGLSQVFIAIDISKLGNHSLITKTVENIIADYHQSVGADASKKIVYPGEGVLQTRKNNLANGIPVLKKVWDEILVL